MYFDVSPIIMVVKISISFNAPMLKGNQPPANYLGDFQSGGPVTQGDATEDPAFVR